MSGFNSYHSFKASGNVFEIDTRYSYIKTIGHGAFGVVVSANDSELSKSVAIKKISNVFTDTLDAKRILREIKLMKQFSHENIIGIIDLIPPSKASKAFEDIYIVQELMDTDLHRIIYSKQELSMDHIEYFVYQILRGLKYLHSANVLHRDLKPSNLLINSNCDLKICDFGLAKISNSDNTEYVVTRWYRAPEIMLASQDYTKAIDLWSVGCIFAEMLARKPLFPGTDYMAQLRLICEKLGRPSESELNFITSQKAKAFFLDLPENATSSIEDIFIPHQQNKDALDLLKSFLIICPDKRISVEKALEHKFMEALHNPDDEPLAEIYIDLDFEKEELTKDRIQCLIWHEITDYHPYILDDHKNYFSSKKDFKSEINSPSSYMENSKLPTRKRSMSPYKT